MRDCCRFAFDNFSVGESFTWCLCFLRKGDHYRLGRKRRADFCSEGRGVTASRKRTEGRKGLAMPQYYAFFSPRGKGGFAARVSVVLYKP